MMGAGTRKKRILIIICSYKTFYLGMMLFCLGWAAIQLRPAAIWVLTPPSELVSGKKVVIDAGHGGVDPGAKSPGGLQEKDINLDVAVKLKKYFGRMGVYCVMVREQDCDFAGYGNAATKKARDLAYRTDLANRSGADLFLSIHANSFPVSFYRGAQTFFNPSRPESKQLAQAIQNQLTRRLGPNRRQARPGDFRVLNDTNMPGVTVEIGFLSNPAETALLEDPHYRERIAAAIYSGVVDFWLTCHSIRETSLKTSLKTSPKNAPETAP